MILLIDNYDSFVDNLARYIRELGRETLVLRNDAVEIAVVRAMDPEAIVISPGPRTPYEAGVSMPLIKAFSGHIPLLGICLGHQALGAAMGGKIIAALEPMHGRASAIHHDGSDLFAGLPNPLHAGRYHALIVTLVEPHDSLRITARSTKGEIMALAHRTHPSFGVQFHPESILTDHGYDLLQNFLHIAETWNAKHRAPRSLTEK